MWDQRWRSVNDCLVHTIKVDNLVIRGKTDALYFRKDILDVG